ncbi:hypothetical protein [Thetidibacter halocola]|uniref:Uncharacterized protein n=1 Tax=Thetidibacter halocola TaxID=2827239 RepID=A0A8J7WGX7_9RHOB|nr:hypothetical protein [Thetidibacter halocola]MBS0124809.1 hypothetical protein [Thetidibacter halocola]
MADLPDYFFRVRDNGALVFRVDTENRNRRIEMEPIAAVNLARDEVKAQGGRDLTKADLVAIRGWMAERQAIAALREIDDIHRTIDQLNRAAHWAQTRAEDVQLDEVTDALLMAMHDLRSVLVRRKAERLARGEAD